jgi:hypothetical protein
VRSAPVAGKLSIFVFQQADFIFGCSMVTFVTKRKGKKMAGRREMMPMMQMMMTETTTLAILLAAVQVGTDLLLIFPLKIILDKLVNILFQRIS